MALTIAQIEHDRAFRPAVTIPTPISDPELDHLHTLARSLAPDGRIVELACFLGGATAALAAGLSNENTSPIQVHDPFRIPDHPPRDQCAWLATHALAPADHYRERFDHLNRDWLHRLDIHEGPLDQQPADDQPIDLLVSTPARSWDEHGAIVRSFFRNVRTDGTVAIPAFFNILSPWNILHLWQLRDAFEPIGLMSNAAMLTFRCTRDPSRVIEGIASPEDLTDPITRREAWAAARAWWAERVGARAAGFTHGHEAVHALEAGDAEHAVDAGRRYEAWRRSRDCKNIHRCPNWADVVDTMPARLDAAGAPSTLAAHNLAAECIARATVPRRPDPWTPVGHYGHEMRRNAWRATRTRLESEGHTRIALFGAGQHTDWLLDAGILDPATIACIIDDKPTGNQRGDIPVVTPATAHAYLTDVSAILPSSDAFENHIINRALELFRDQPNLTLIRVYTDSNIHLAGTPTPQPTTIDTADPLIELDPLEIPPIAPERADLGLPARREWIRDFFSVHRMPDWAYGHVNSRDALFLWDVVEAARPRNVVEIGTASGVSTAMLAAAVEQFCDDDVAVSTFDIASLCYFDHTRPVGAVLEQAVPHLTHRVHVHPLATAVDAARHFGIGEIELLFIDGDHTHPAPTLDLLALVYALAPRAWVILHDIELTAVFNAAVNPDWEPVTGAERLFDTWPFGGVQPHNNDPTLNNIGAIRMPETPTDAVPVLLDLLRQPWETRDTPPETLRPHLDTRTIDGDHDARP